MAASGWIGRQAREMNPSRLLTRQNTKEGSYLSSAPVRLQSQRETRQATNWNVNISATIIENMGLFPGAELNFLLACIRVDPANNPKSQRHPTVTDDQWQKWTNLSVRAKQTAIKGLSQKGLTIYGSAKGKEEPRYFLDLDKCVDYIQSHTYEEKGRTHGRKESVAAKPGQQIHPDCAERGCQKLCDTESCDAPPKPKIVSINGEEQTQPVAFPISKSLKTNKCDFELPWPGCKFPETVKALWKWFPEVDHEFLTRLRSVSQLKAKKFSDEQLAAAVRAAWKKNQESAGLFLHTVPAQLAAIVSGRASSNTPPPAEPRFNENNLKAFVSLHAQQLKKAAMEDLAQRVQLLDLELLPDQLEEQLREIEAVVIARLRARTPLSALKASIDQELGPHMKGKTPEQVERLRQQFTDRKLVESAGLSWLSLYYL